MYALGAAIALSVCLALRFVPGLNDVVLGKLDACDSQLAAWRTAWLLPNRGKIP
jgi:hypothetical protein